MYMYKYTVLIYMDPRNGMVLIASSRKETAFYLALYKLVCTPGTRAASSAFANIFHIEPIQLPFFYRTLFCPSIYTFLAFCSRLDISWLLRPAVNIVSFFFHGLILIDIRESRDGKWRNVLCICAKNLFSA